MQDRPVIWISRSVLEFIHTDGFEHSPLETGGVIMGWVSGNQIIVYAVSGPGPKAKHSQAKFLPDHEYRLKFIEDWHFLSDGRISYLGDWHTHPQQQNPQMSFLDKKELFRISKFKEVNLQYPIMLIAGLKNEGLIKGWTISQRPILRFPRYHEVEMAVFCPSIFADQSLPEFYNNRSA